MNGRLARRLAVVTGASRGIGRAISAALAAEGGDVVMLARRADALRAAARDIGQRATPLPCDVSDLRVVTDTIASLVTERGSPDVLVNNAGLFPLAAIESTSDEEVAATLRTNVAAPFALIRAVLPGMRARGSGHIVNIGSVADHATLPENGAYAASKHALRALHLVLREELRGSGVRATLVSPGPVNTPVWDPIDPDRRPGFTPRAAMLASDAVAAAVVFAVTQPPDVNIDELRLSRA